MSRFFDDLRELPPDEGARRLADLIAVGPESRENPADKDSAAIALLADRRAGDPMLAHLELGTLELLVERCAERLGSGASDTQIEMRKVAWQLLDVLRRSRLLCRISEAGATEKWAAHIRDLVECSHFTFGQLFAQRAAGYGERTLFRLPAKGSSRTVSWRQAAGRVDLIARSLLAATAGEENRTVAILSANSLEMVLLDLACLSSGIVNVMIPATATETDVAYILDHAKVGTLFVSDREQLQKVLNVRDRLPGLGEIFCLRPIASPGRGVADFEHLLARASDFSPEALAGRRRAQKIDDLATIMYTSGTTGTPKGICFSQRNIVYKRFARALALPEIGEDDRFLCYLPLFHTFGRFLEMTGCVFWGAVYCFAENPSIETLTAQMRELEATVLISIPMKWMQLYEQVRQRVDVETADDVEIDSALRRVVGPGLRWGLSAAGYLDPDIFRFFQSHNLEVMSGFGMTEATGGITMTPPGKYEEDSLGPPLPGIEATLADDGELIIRGPYVMQGYLDPPNGVDSFDEAGWFHTGDLMERDENGFFRIVDRKKEIYKNISGQTIAPQKIENLFRDFASVGRVFLVGDHREYNTALIFPDPDFEDVDFDALDSDEIKTHFRSLVVSANSFLAPYERIVDFAVIDRDFDAEHGELTAKGTFRRKAIERSFADQIRLLYRRTTIKVGGAEVTVPNWFFQALGITAQELLVDGDRLQLASHNTELTVVRDDDECVRIGAAVYRPNRRAIDLGHLLATPRLWLGNEELVGFAPLLPAQRDRRRRRSLSADWVRRVGPYKPRISDRDEAPALLHRQGVDLLDLHRAALLLASEDHEDAIAAVRILDHILDLDDGDLSEQTLRILRRAVASRSPLVQRRAFQVLATAEIEERYRQTLTCFLDQGERLLDSETISVLADKDLLPEQIAAFIDEAEDRGRGPSDPPDPNLSALFDFLASYGASHPSRYRQLRGFFTRSSITAPSTRVRELAVAARARLAQDFRAWLGASSRVAVDPETGLEYRWEDVVAFADEVDKEARERLLLALRTTPIIREAAVLFGGGPTIRLEDILPGGVWVRLLGSSHGKSVFRMAIRTRVRDQLDLALNLNRDLSPEAAQEEVDWLIVCSEARGPGPVVEVFGGAWPEHGLWTEEFIPGETLDHALRRLARRGKDPDRLTGWWPFAAWAALSAYVDFWNRTGRRLVVEDPSPANVIVPLHDYHTGARLVSISSRGPFRSVLGMLRSFHNNFITPVETEHTELRNLVGWDTLFSAVLEIVGEQEGIDHLHEVLAATRETDCEMAESLVAFLESVGRRGFLPRRLFFAAKRFRRWERLNPDATLTARARTLHEIFGTYGLADLQASYPEARARFFRETVFRGGSGVLAEGLDEVIARLRNAELAPDDLSAAVADLRAHLRLEPEEDYFLARLSYPYLRPEDEAEFVAAAAGGTRQSEMVVTREDAEGYPYRIRHALSPKEVGRLHRLFLAAKLQVQFRPEHRFLVAIGDRGNLIGGLFYEEQPEAHTAHMDKVVVAERFQGRGIASALVEELCNRLRTAGYRSLTTGFFRPLFFYRMGFAVERRHAGLVRSLGHENGAASSPVEP
ncbi:MAG: GNAT family N-acetyltransferase [Thermoanaerobaculales bacterium]